jgi:enoyl-CoA hydratase
MKTPEATRPSAVTYERRGRVGLVRLNRPEVRNAMSQQLLDDLHRALDAMEADSGAHAGVLSGNGPSFCAGFDLGKGSASTASTASDPWADRRRLVGWMELGVRMWEFRRPIIAQVHGHCLGGGNLFLLCSDLVVIADDCAVGWPRLPMGAGFMDGAMSLLVGQRRAKQIAYVVGTRLTGSEAAEWGLANLAVPPAELEERTMAMARRIAKAPVSVLEIRKAAITRVQAARGYREALLAGAEWDAIAHATPAVDEYRALVRQHGMNTVIKAYEESDDPIGSLKRTQPDAAADGDGNRRHGEARDVPGND